MDERPRLVGVRWVARIDLVMRSISTEDLDAGGHRAIAIGLGPVEPELRHPVYRRQRGCHDIADSDRHASPVGRTLRIAGHRPLNGPVCFSGEHVADLHVDLLGGADDRLSRRGSCRPANAKQTGETRAREPVARRSTWPDPHRNRPALPFRTVFWARLMQTAARLPRRGTFPRESARVVRVVPSRQSRTDCMPSSVATGRTVRVPAGRLPRPEPSSSGRKTDFLFPRCLHAGRAVGVSAARPSTPIEPSTWPSHTPSAGSTTASGNHLGGEASCSTRRIINSVTEGFRVVAK